jgi:hypothetical protein
MSLDVLPPEELPARIAVRVDLLPADFLALAEEATALGLSLPAFVAFVLNREAARIKKSRT